MTGNADDRLGDDLRAAFGHGLPDRTFADGVRDRIEGPAGQRHEIRVRLPRRRLLPLLAGVAALVVLVAGVARFAVSSSNRTDPPIATAGEDADPPPAPGEDPAGESPPSQEPTGPIPGVLRIQVAADGSVRCEGRDVSPDRLRALLERHAATGRPSGSGDAPSDLRLLLRIHRRTPWRAVQRITQVCAEPGVRIYRITVKHLVGLPGAAPPELPPVHEAGPREPGTLRIGLAAVRGRVELRWADHPFGSGEEARRALTARVAEAREADAHLRVELHATRDVPPPEVIRVVDALLAAGQKEITFVGAPPGTGTPIDIRVFLAERDGKRVPCLALPWLDRDGRSTDGLPPTMEEGLPRIAARIRDLRREGVPRVRVFVGRQVPWITVRELRRDLEEKRKIEPEILPERE